MPCIHLRTEPQYRSPQGLAAALRAVARLDPKPAFIATGGDLCHDLRSEGLEGATARADLFVEILKENSDLPVYHCLGNHDPAGWGKGNIPRDHPQFGFNLLKQKLGMPDLYYSFDHGPWHFVALHNVKLTEPGRHTGEWMPEQMAFLKEDLRKNRARPTILFAHIPAVSAIEFFDGRARSENSAWVLDQGRATGNPQALVEAMSEGKVKAVLSGHIHRLDRIEAMGHTFICSGSVSGARWAGPDHATPEGFGVLDCRPDGTFTYRYHAYGWRADSAAK
jgi:3',5'-cyclic AMP phosphodiesterase CpdA